MIESVAERTIIRYLSVGVPLASAFVWASGTTDPVNITKLFVMGGVGLAVGVTTCAFFWGRWWKFSKPMLTVILLFQMAMINSLVNGQGPFLQSYYGVSGRQTGFLTYFFLTLILVSASLVWNSKLHVNLVKGLLFVGVLNILYCGWVLVFGDFLPWNNIYRSILGLFGNPDFISAFLGIFIVVCFSIFLKKNINLRERLLLVSFSAVAFFEIIKSHAIQGIVVTAGGLSLVVFFYLRSICKTWVIPFLYTCLASALGLLAILGTLQMGPLSFVYKRSVSLRGSYWHAGLGMGSRFPVSGVGLDGYGDFYRQTRPPVALVDMPGVQVVSNVAHNVFIDFFASGGWPLLVTYSLLNLLVMIAIFKHIRKEKKYDHIFVALSTAWICYTVQSVISINQVGLAIWGWVIAGSLLGYTRTVINTESPSDVGRAKNIMKATNIRAKGTFFSPQLVAGIACVVGLFISYPPLGSDIKWKSALESRDLATLESSLKDSFLNPVPSSRYVMAYQIFGNSNLPDKALDYTRIIVKSNPNFFEGWKALYLMPASSKAEKDLAAKNMKRLDPLNPNVFSSAS
jgi:hypothetical protein